MSACPALPAVHAQFALKLALHQICGSEGTGLALGFSALNFAAHTALSRLSFSF